MLRTLHAAADGFDFSAGDGPAEPGALISLLVASGTFASRGEARRMIQSGGLSVNDERVTDPEAGVPAPVAGEWLVVRVGKRRLRIGRRVA